MFLFLADQPRLKPSLKTQSFIQIMLFTYQILIHLTNVIFEFLFFIHQTTSFFIVFLQIIFQILFSKQKVFDLIHSLLTVSLFKLIKDVLLYSILQQTLQLFRYRLFEVYFQDYLFFLFNLVLIRQATVIIFLLFLLPKLCEDLNHSKYFLRKILMLPLLL